MKRIIAACLLCTACNPTQFQGIANDLVGDLGAQLPPEIRGFAAPLLSQATNQIFEDIKRSMSEDEVRSMRTFIQSALTTVPDDDSAQWRSPATGAQGLVELHGTSAKDGRTCREFRQQFDLIERDVRSTETACLADSGQWEVQPKPQTAGMGGNEALALFLILGMMASQPGGGGGGYADDPGGGALGQSLCHGYGDC